MDMKIRAYTERDLPQMIAIWNEVVAAGNAFPQEELLTLDSGRLFFAAQTYCGVAVSEKSRGLHIGEKLVLDGLVQGKAHGFGVLQFNAVVATNIHARHLYERLGFVQLGTIPHGFRMKDGHYEDICLYYHEL